MDRTLLLLKKYGFTEYESRAYITLLQSSDISGYEISKLSGIPRSKVYNVLEKLKEKGIILSSKAKPFRYRAIDLNQFIEQITNQTAQDLNCIQQTLSELHYTAFSETLWSLTDYQEVLSHAIRMIQNAKEDVYIQVWSSTITPTLLLALQEAQQRLHKVVIILFNDCPDNVKTLTRFYNHGFEEDKLFDFGAVFFNLVVDSAEAIYGTLTATNVDMLLTTNHSFVKIAKEYVIHDAYTLKMIETFKQASQQQFGENLEGIRNIYL